MRIIAGEYKGRKLKSIAAKEVRPTQDSVKEAIFNILRTYPEGKSCLDLFAGFGSLGLEALSRGAKFVDFVELRSRNCRVIQENIELISAQAKTAVKCQAVLSFLENCSNNYDLIFMDPPYASQDYSIVLEQLVSLRLLNNPAVLVIEHGVDKKPEIPEEYMLIKEKQYGTTGILIIEFQGYGN
ncbi:MAG: 16S rRNA (guanine(966)-N(2))-methyltransferase RsmD [Bacillota bacterium]